MLFSRTNATSWDGLDSAGDRPRPGKVSIRDAYPPPMPGALLKETDHLTPDYRRFVEASPFLVVASAGADRVDCSPRGDGPGFVQVIDERTLLLPDQPGNNRLDTFHNLQADPRVALLFLVPGIAEMLRIRGRAELQIGNLEERAPAALRIAVESVFFHCGRAIRKSGLWDPARHVLPHAVPSSREIMATIRQGERR